MGFSISTLLEVDGEGEFFKTATSIPTVTLTALKNRGHSIDESENQHIAWLSLNFILKTS